MNSKISTHESKEIAKELQIAKQEIQNVFFGHESVVDSLFRALLCDGHVLLEGIPGIAKTLLIKTLAKVSDVSSKRVQFTVDLLPSDIVGLTTYTPKKGFEVVKGPIFANFLIADEINRSPPKTQSALIESMQEKQVTIGKKTYKLPEPFFVMATQNPIENEGVYNLPEAQVDRFIFKVNFSYPPPEDEIKLMEQNATFTNFEELKIKPRLNASKIKKMQKKVHEVYLDARIKNYIMKIVSKTRNDDFKYSEYINLGASPRATIYLFLASKANALMNGRNYVLPQDVEVCAHDVLRHRLMLSYKATAAKIDSDKIVDEILRTTGVH